MLTTNQIIKICKEGVDIIFREKGMENLKGEYDPSSLDIILYCKNIESVFDRDLTLLHEFIHARNDILNYHSCKEDKGEDEKIENEALMTYLKKLYVLEFIKHYML
jgi:hypothetical protein